MTRTACRHQPSRLPLATPPPETPRDGGRPPGLLRRGPTSTSPPAARTVLKTSVLTGTEESVRQKRTPGRLRSCGCCGRRADSGVRDGSFSRSTAAGPCGCPAFAELSWPGACSSPCPEFPHARGKNWPDTSRDQEVSPRPPPSRSSRALKALRASARPQAWELLHEVLCVPQARARWHQRCHGAVGGACADESCTLGARCACGTRGPDPRGLGPTDTLCRRSNSHTRTPVRASPQPLFETAPSLPVSAACARPPRAEAGSARQASTAHQRRP